MGHAYEPCWVEQSKMDGSWWRVLAKCAPLEKGRANHERQKDRTLKYELPRLVGAQYATGNQWRNNSRKNEEMEPKQKHHPVADVTGDGSRNDAVKSNIAEEPGMLGP